MGYFQLKKTHKKTEQPYYFVLYASNGEPIATSAMYASKQGAQNGIRSVKENAPEAEIRDLTTSAAGATGKL